ncbi:MAG: ROK family protein [Candidatus Omnitrophota bacterium]
MAISKDGLLKYVPLNDEQRECLAVLEATRKTGPLSRAELTKRSGCNAARMTHCVDGFVRKQLIREKVTGDAAGGKKTPLLEICKGEHFFIGIDFNRKTVNGIVADLSLNILREVSVARPAIVQDEVEKAIVGLINGLLEAPGVEKAKIRFIGIGVYGMFNEVNMTIKGLDEEKGRSRATIYYDKVKQLLEKKFGITVFFGTDAAFAAFGERAKNVDLNTSDMLYIFQDIGRGVILKDEIYCGTDISSIDTEGLLGDLSPEEKQRLKEEALYLRPWNTKVSLRSEALKVIETGVGTKIVEYLQGDLGRLTDDVIIKAARENDEIAVELISGVGINLGVRIAYLINLFSPRIVVIGGGVERAGDLLFGQIKRTIEKLSLKKTKDVAGLYPSVLGEKAVVVGAVAVALREVFLEA